ncbi:MAG: hypothetical protein J2P48_21850 [Alphaproteobacteria bacterium]|nr:hypothetical protein [Alphaproteobacteria bacterium]
MKYTFVDTCFDTHHLQFGFDKDDTLWTTGGGGARTFTKVYIEQARGAADAQDRLRQAGYVA